ncbi:hypothetical protein [Stenoxybacter acetivorans]|uniref:hypothetical protein n=1 Tax=Stenoxybacter acetivorans TaxID=422441 RepID=UPI00056C9B16|nr:hypothetical protein [Stenoxybacter acetivorans]
MNTISIITEYKPSMGIDSVQNHRFRFIQKNAVKSCVHQKQNRIQLGSALSFCGVLCEYAQIKKAETMKQQ